MNEFDNLADLKIRTLRRKVLGLDSLGRTEVELIVRLLDQEVERIGLSRCALVKPAGGQRGLIGPQRNDKTSPSEGL